MSFASCFKKEMKVDLWIWTLCISFPFWLRNSNNEGTSFPIIFQENQCSQLSESFSGIGTTRWTWNPNSGRQLSLPRPPHSLRWEGEWLFIFLCSQEVLRRVPAPRINNLVSCNSIHFPPGSLVNMSVRGGYSVSIFILALYLLLNIFLSLFYYIYLFFF